MLKENKHIICTESRKILLENFQQRQSKYHISLFGMEFIQYRDVFPADIFKDAEFFTPDITSFESKDFLEIGIGSGVTSIIAALKGNNVTGVDINPSAVRNAIENAKLHNVKERCSFIVSDLFEKIKGKKFDIIYWNAPFCYCSNNVSLLEKSIIDHNYQSLNNFFSSVRSNLKESGKIFLGFSNRVGNKEMLLQIVDSNGFKHMEMISQKEVYLKNIEFDLTLYNIQIKTKK